MRTAAFRTARKKSHIRLISKEIYLFADITQCFTDETPGLKPGPSAGTPCGPYPTFR
jgi:hypothetical protein